MKRVTKADLLAKIARMEAFAQLPIAVVRPLHQHVLRDVPGFVSAEQYGDGSPMKNEIGRTRAFRFISEQLPHWSPNL